MQNSMSRKSDTEYLLKSEVDRLKLELELQERINHNMESQLDFIKSLIFSLIEDKVDEKIQKHLDISHGRKHT